MTMNGFPKHSLSHFNVEIFFCEVYSASSLLKPSPSCWSLCLCVWFTSDQMQVSVKQHISTWSITDRKKESNGRSDPMSWYVECLLPFNSCIRNWGSLAHLSISAAALSGTTERNPAFFCGFEVFYLSFKLYAVGSNFVSIPGSVQSLLQLDLKPWICSHGATVMIRLQITNSIQMLFKKTEENILQRLEEPQWCIARIWRHSGAVNW